MTFSNIQVKNNLSTSQLDDSGECVCTEFRRDFLSHPTQIRLAFSLSGMGTHIPGGCSFCGGRARYNSPGFTTFPPSSKDISPARPHPPRAILRPCTCPKVHIHSLSSVGGILGCCKHRVAGQMKKSIANHALRLVLSALLRLVQWGCCCCVTEN
jgi:hypothetical protein